MKQGKNDICPLKASDWINFLQNRQIAIYSMSNIITMLFIATYSIFFSLIVSIRVSEMRDLQSIILFFAMLGFAGFLMWILGRKMLNQIKEIFGDIDEIQKLIDEIINGKLTDSTLIREKWHNIKK